MIAIQGVYKSFFEKQVLNNLNLTVQGGETTVVIGRSGVGKSVLLRCIMGLLPVDAGSIEINGIDVTQLGERDYNAIRRKIGIVFQGGALFDSMTVAENVAFALTEFGHLDAAVLEERVKRSLAVVGLHATGHLMPSKLSGGMRKRVSIARALCIEPELIFYDEPTDEVDPVTRDTINNLINKLRDELHVTSIVVTHDMQAAYKVADRIAMLYHGHVIADGTPEQIRTSTHPVVSQFVNGQADGPILEDEELILKYL